MDFLPFTRPDIDDETIAGVVEVLRSGWITSGPQVKAFEAALSAYLGGRDVRVFSSGTAALEVALRMAGIGAGDEVITTPLTWVATANVILAVGARPVFVDIDPLTRNIDLARVEAAITPRTRAILPVDLAGLPVDRDRLYAIAQQHRLRVIEDAAQAMGANWRGQRIGSFGDYVALSFHANKNMTSTEGGALVLPAGSDLGRCERWRLQGVQRFADGTMDVDLPGGKSNLTDVAARIGLGQLARLDAFNERRRQLARRYFASIDRSLGLELPPEDYDQSNWHMFQLVLPLARMRGGRDGFIKAMAARSIGIGVHYPPLHRFTLYRELGWKAGDFPHAERVGDAIVTLPLFPRMTEDDVVRVCDAVAAVVRASLADDAAQ
jgi:dTDP-4-amino-4,6-dideoxygalactose transaminase